MKSNRDSLNCWKSLTHTAWLRSIPRYNTTAKKRLAWNLYQFASDMQMVHHLREDGASKC